MTRYDAVLLMSFGGPEGPDDVMPFLENVTRGKSIPRVRLEEVAERYLELGGVSPINSQCRRLRAALQSELDAHDMALPVYWGNRNWHPMLADTVSTMATDGISNALALVTSAYSSYSGCRQYLDDIEKARAEVGPNAPTIHKIRPFFNHPGFIEPFAEATAAAVDEHGDHASAAHIIFTAHSIPLAMADGCDYRSQLREVARLIAERQQLSLPWDLVWQSRSGPPSVPWLQPDVNDHIRALAEAGTKAAVLVPIGFVFDHMEVIFDLDEEATATAAEVGIRVSRATTPATRPSPRFVSMCRELIAERFDAGPAPLSLGDLPPLDSRCRPDCCSPR